MAILDYLGKVVALLDGTKIGTVQDIERQPITQRFSAIIELVAPWKGQTIKVPIGELRKITDNAFSLSKKYSESVRKELAIDPEPTEIQPTAETDSSSSRPSSPHIPKVYSPPPRSPPPRSPPPEPISSGATPSTSQPISQDTAVWSQISEQISGKKKPRSPLPPVSQTPPPHTSPPESAPEPVKPKTPPSPPVSQVSPANHPSVKTPTEIKCPKCRKKVQADFKFCPHCRYPLFCINCGYPIRDRKWKACPKCGFGFK